MVRTFQTHKIRKNTELSAGLWDFSASLKDGKHVSMKVAVPSCWENYPDTLTFRGKGCYERDFCAEGNIRLEFKGVSHTATVLLDGKEIVSHYNAYTPFSVIVKDLKAGTHHLTVYADNSFGPESALHVPNDYQTYGGITRPVVLEELKQLCISVLHITPYQKDGIWYADVKVAAENLSDCVFSGELELKLGDNTWHKQSICLEGHQKQQFCVSGLCCPDVMPWNPDTPVLYEVSAVIKEENGQEIDDLIDRIGFREVRIEGNQILFNGKPLRIKGFCRHEDHPQFGCAIPAAAMQQDLMLMKDMGANSVRTSHYPNDELFLDFCDELGILVWEENHARGLSEEAMRNPNFEPQAEACICEMIEAHYNHPSIYIWGIMNECASDTEYGKVCYKAQFELIKELDQSRPHSFASCRYKTDRCLGMPDVISYNIYPQWYLDIPVEKYLDELYQWIQNESGGGDKPFLITEIGAGGIYGYRTPAKVKWSEDYQAEALEKQLTAVLDYEGCSGVYIWQFCDCRVCDSWFASRPRTMNNKGIVDEYRRPKLAYDVVKHIFHEK